MLERCGSLRNCAETKVFQPVCFEKLVYELGVWHSFRSADELGSLEFLGTIQHNKQNVKHNDALLSIIWQWLDFRVDSEQNIGGFRFFIDPSIGDRPGAFLDVRFHFDLN